MNLLDSANFGVVLNWHRRSLTPSKVAEILTKEVIGLVASLEVLTKAAFDGASSLKVARLCTRSGGVSISAKLNA